MSDLSEHPFAQYVRIIGKGKSTYRSFTFEEAYEAMTFILKEEVEPLQLGAFLLLLRVKGEDANEMAGFAKAAKDFIQAPDIAVDIDWPSYAGKHKQQPWYILAALTLAANGHKVFMHGPSTQFGERLYTETVLDRLGIPVCKNWQEVQQQLDQTNFAYASLSTFCQPLDKLFAYRPLLGVRSPVNSLVKLINPLGAKLGLQSVFHPAYLEVHQQAALLLKQTKSLVLKGEGGEVEFRPDADNRLFLLNESQCSVETWSRRIKQRQAPLTYEQMSTKSLVNQWAGDIGPDQNDYATEAILATMAMVIFAAGNASSEVEACKLARQYWLSRPKILPITRIGQ